MTSPQRPRAAATPTASSEGVTAELLPCPFCGAAALIDDHGVDEELWVISCSNHNCDVQPTIQWVDSKSSGIAAWNRRTPDLAARQKIEQLRGALIASGKAAGAGLADTVGVKPEAEISRLTSEDDAPPTESILRPLADREKSADNLMDEASKKRRHAAALITDAEALEQLAYDTADYCGGGEP